MLELILIAGFIIALILLALLFLFFAFIPAYTSTEGSSLIKGLGVLGR